MLLCIPVHGLQAFEEADQSCEKERCIVRADADGVAA
jgi:hypothetical protein